MSQEATCNKCKYWSETGYDQLSEQFTGTCPVVSKGLEMCDENTIPCEIATTYETFGCIYFKPTEECLPRLQ